MKVAEDINTTLSSSILDAEIITRLIEAKNKS
jgi:hypothetical protein